MIYYGRQSINDSDIESVVKILKSDFLTQGPTIERFEKCVAEYCGAKYAVAVTNATSALHIACLAAGLGTGDSLCFTASANCGRYCGADVEFVDIDENTYNMSVQALEEKLQVSEKLPKVIVPVHLAGQSCDMKKIFELAKKYNFTILEDASHAVGADYLSFKVGACKYSDMAVFSFHPVKIITTGEGGMILTNRKDLYEKLLLYRSHCITRNPALMTHDSDGSWYYQQIDLGFNYRMTDIQAALGLSQMQRLDKFIEKRRKLAVRYDEKLKNLPLKIPYVAQDTNPSWHLYIVRVNFDKVTKTKQQIFDEMKARGITLNLHYIPVHTQPYYEKLGHRPEECPNSLEYYRDAMTLPLYYDLTESQQDFIVKSLSEVLRD